MVSGTRIGEPPSSAAAARHRRYRPAVPPGRAGSENATGTMKGVGEEHRVACARMQRRVLVVSASMGAGHDGAARELARRLEDDGHVTEVRDFMKSAPLKIGDVVRVGYE